MTSQGADVLSLCHARVSARTALPLTTVLVPVDFRTGNIDAGEEGSVLVLYWDLRLTFYFKLCARLPPQTTDRGPPVVTHLSPPLDED
jgi:hypothetical protein